MAVIGLCFGTLTSLNAETTPSDFEYRIEGDEAIITKYLGTDLDVVFPNEIEGKPVTGIDYRFYDAADLSGNHNKNNITSCQLPENLRYIRNRLFDHCTNLATIQIPANVETIGELAFSGCYKLTELHIPNGVKTIGPEIIAICNNIKTINIPASVEDIYGGIYSESFGMNAFAWSYGLEEITVDEENPFYRAIDGVLFNKEGTTLLQYPCGRPGAEYVIPEGVTKLAWGSFLKAGYLETIRFPSSLKVINEASFHQCTSLTSIDIPDTVQAIRAGAFQGCSNLKQVTIGTGVELLEGHAFSKCQVLENVYFKGNCPEIDYLGLPDLVFPGYSLPGVIFTRNEPCPNVYYVEGTEGWDDPEKLDWLDPEKLFTWTPEAPPSDFEYRIEGDEAIITNYLGTDLDVVFPNEINGKTVTGIDYAFWENDKNNITSCQLPENLKYIGRGLFYHCTNLTEIQIPAGVETIGSRAFSGCNKLTELHIPNGVKSIGYWVIARCKKIKTINIPASVEDIYGGLYSESSVMKMNAFSWSDGLEEITVDEENPFYRAIDGVLFNKEGTTLLQYPCGRPGAEYVIPEGVTKLAWGSFLETIYLETVRFPSSLETINEYSFFKCSSLTSIDIPDTVQTIDSVAFALCSNLKQVIVGTGVTCLKTYAFVSCPALESVYFKGNCPEIDESIFNGDVPNPYYPNVYYVEGTEGWDDPEKLDWLDPEKLSTWTPEAPYLFVSKKDLAEMKIVFSGELQTSDDLENWITVHTESPYQDTPAQDGQKFFRVKK